MFVDVVPLSKDGYEYCCCCCCNNEGLVRGIVV